jgi:peptidoglycan/xylan/chitin deacetylase (PgdA/CDA1 family)
MNYKKLIIPLAVIILPALIWFNMSHEKIATVRMDDIQDYWLSEVQVKIIETHLKYDVPISVAIIGGRFGDDPQMVKALKRLIEKGLGEVLNHSWDHKELKGRAYEDQVANIRSANQRISKILGVEPTILIPPKWSYDKATLRACEELGMRCITKFKYSVFIPEWDDKSQNWKKFDADRAIGKIEQTYSLYGKVDVYIHFQGIDDMEGYDRLVKWLSAHYRVVKLSEFVKS